MSLESKLIKCIGRGMNRSERLSLVGQVVFAKSGCQYWVLFWLLWNEIVLEVDPGLVAWAGNLCQLASYKYLFVRVSNLVFVNPRWLLFRSGPNSTRSECGINLWSLVSLIDMNLCRGDNSVWVPSDHGAQMHNMIRALILELHTYACSICVLPLSKGK